MALSNELTIIVIVVAVVAVLCIFVAICCCLRSVFKNRNAAIDSPQVICRPPPGVYPAPLSVELHSISADWQILVRVINQTPLHRNRVTPDGPTPTPTPRPPAVPEPGTPAVIDDTAHPAIDREFMLYRDPLIFNVPGTYEVCAYTEDEASLHRSPFAYYTYVIHPDARAPEPKVFSLKEPTIVPESGEITDRTKVVILSDYNSATHAVHIAPAFNVGPSAGGSETGRGAKGTGGGGSNLNVLDWMSPQIRYSIDGTPPSLIYTNPFTIDRATLTGTTRGVADVVVKAQVVLGSTASYITEARLRVVSSRCVIFDPTIPAPTADVEAINPAIYFTHPKKDAQLYFVIVPLSSKRHDVMQESHHSRSQSPGRGEGKQQSSKLKDLLSDGTLYRNTCIPLHQEIAEVHAWAVDPKTNHRSHISTYDVVQQTSYRTETPNVSPARRKDHGRGSASFPPPEIFLTCSDARISFPPCPAAFSLRYTLDGTEPTFDEDDRTTMTVPAAGLATPLHFTRGQVGTVQFVARFFQVAQNGDIRFGHRLARMFCCQ